jgi:uridine kinase
MNPDSTGIDKAVPPSTIRVTLPDGRSLEGSSGSTLESFLRRAGFPGEPTIVAAVYRKVLQELGCPVTQDGLFVPVTIAASDGARIYRRSLVLLMLAAVNELFPGADVAVDHSISDGGFFCETAGREPFSPEELQAIETRMRAISAADEPILRREVGLDEAVAIFTRQKMEDKLRLLRSRSKEYLTIYTLRGLVDYLHGFMVPSTGYLRLFQLDHAARGFTLRYPRQQMPQAIGPRRDFPKLRATFEEYSLWQERLGLEDVGELNEAIVGGRGGEVILVSEALHDQKTAEIARRIVAARDRIRLVLIAGPSSSGKTTFSRRLAIQMLSQGLRPFPLEMDNYFVDRADTPRDASGQPDFEAFEALDRALLTDNLRRLLREEEVALPRFNFQEGRREPGDTVRLPPNAVVIMEGIHGLNPELLANFHRGEVFRIYVSALTQLNLDRHSRISTTDCRLIRRIVRDAAQRGHPPSFTISRWEMVRAGERKYIFPYQENADVMFNSALVYELAVLRTIAEPLLRQVDPESPEYVEAKRLLAFLAWFRPLPPDNVPEDSILREFIGGSILEKFKVWGA